MITGDLLMKNRYLSRNWETDRVTYPEPAVEVVDERFNKYVIFNAALERIYTGCRWAEGPAWFGDGGYLLWSDIPNDRIMRWDEKSEHVAEYRSPSNYSNGNTRDLQGRLITCEHLSRSVTRTEYDGSVITLAHSFKNVQLNAPNDVTLDRDGAVWFTDPGYGILNNYEGNRSSLTSPTAVYRIDPISGDLDIKVQTIEKPNGLCFSPDYKKLYVADSRSDKPKSIYAFNVSEDGTTLSNQMIFSDTGDDSTDGICCDTDGNVWATAQYASNSINIFSPGGILIGKIYLPEIPSNLTFGGRKKNRLFITASQSIYSIYTDAIGASLA